MCLFVILKKLLKPVAGSDACSSGVLSNFVKDHTYHLPDYLIFLVSIFLRDFLLAVI